MFNVIEIMNKNEKFFVELSQEQEQFLCELKQRLLQDNSLDLTDSDVVKNVLDYVCEEWKKDKGAFLSIALLNGQNVEGGVSNVQSEL